MKNRFPAAGREAFFTGIPLDKRRCSAIMSVPIVLVQFEEKCGEKREHFPLPERLYLYGRNEKVSYEKIIKRGETE